MIIERENTVDGRVVDHNDYLAPVTYVPGHAHGDCGHPDAEQGVIISSRDAGIGVLYCKSRTVQMTDPGDLRWG